MSIYLYFKIKYTHYRYTLKYTHCKAILRYQINSNMNYSGVTVSLKFIIFYLRRAKYTNICLFIVWNSDKWRRIYFKF